MYGSDYGYSGNNCSRKTYMNVASSLCVSNWLANFNGITLTAMSDSNFISLDYDGILRSQSSHSISDVRPVLYLKDSVYKINGTGTFDDPYIIGM